MNQPRLLIVKLSSLGDLFAALPTVHAIRQSTDGIVDWVTQPAYVNLVESFSDVRRVVPFPRRNFWRNIQGYCRAVRLEEYDLAIDLQGLLKSALALRFARAKERIGPSQAREGARFLYHRAPPPGSPGRHAIEKLLDTARFLGCSDLSPVFPLSIEPMPWTTDHPRIALIPCSRWSGKNWRLKGFIDTARGLQDSVKASLVLLGSPADKGVCNAIHDAVPGATNLCGATDLLEMCRWLRAMDLVITVDSGPMHAAAALGVRVLALFGPTDPIRVGPYGPGHRVMESVRARNLAQSLRSWKQVPAEAMSDIGADDVVATAVSMLAES